jgi:hypothetical protein
MNSPLAQQAAVKPHWSVWVGRVLSGLIVLSSIGSGVAKILHASGVIEMLVGKLGYPESAVAGTGITEILCALIYAVPKTRVLGAVLLTGYLGGAVAIHVRASDLFIAPLMVGIFVWVALFLRDGAIRKQLPLVS